MPDAGLDQRSISRLRLETYMRTHQNFGILAPEFLFFVVRLSNGAIEGTAVRYQALASDECQVSLAVDFHFE